MAPDPTEPLNPYAPPRAVIDPRAPLDDGDSGDFKSERRSVVLCMVLTVLTSWLYPPIWLWRRRPFLKRLDASNELGPVLPVVILICSFCIIVLQLAGHGQGNASLQVGGIAGVATVAASLRVAGILRSEFARTGRVLSVSSAGAFFFGILYLQYKINQGAVTPVRVPQGETRDVE
jgi:hypothetical protein